MTITAEHEHATEEALILLHGIHYEKGVDDSPVIHPPWLPPVWGRFYDLIMERWIFPGKFNGSLAEHDAFMRSQLRDFRNQRIVEIGTGSGTASGWLDKSSSYRGIDISPALLKIAQKKFTRRGFTDVSLYATDAVALPFAAHAFDLCLCILTLNFIEDEIALFTEIGRILDKPGTFFCCVPVPERASGSRTIRGTLRSMKQLQEALHACGLSFKPLSFANGSLLYFTSSKREYREERS